MLDELSQYIKNASNAIDDAITTLNKSNRGKVARTILKSARDLNDAIAMKLYTMLYPNKNMSINKAAQQFTAPKELKFISQFNQYLQFALSHFTPSEDSAERLMLKYFNYFIQLKDLAKSQFNMEILLNINNYLLDLDDKTQKYYQSIASVIESPFSLRTELDTYYINRITPFCANNHIYYEVVLEPAEEKVNKFNRITAYTKFKITTNYAVAISFTDKIINVFDVNVPIKIIVDWQVSIRPCEINNFAKIFYMQPDIRREHNEMDELK